MKKIDLEELLLRWSSATEEQRIGAIDVLMQKAPTAPSQVIRRIEAAKRLGVTPRTLDNLIKKGRLSRVKVGRASGIAEQEIAEFIAAGGCK